MSLYEEYSADETLYVLGDTGAVVLGIVSVRELIAQRSNTGMPFFSVIAVVCCDLVVTSPLKHVVLWQWCPKPEQKACTLGTNHKGALSNSGCKLCHFKNDRSWGAKKFSLSLFILREPTRNSVLCVLNLHLVKNPVTTSMCVFCHESLRDHVIRCAISVRGCNNATQTPKQEQVLGTQQTEQPEQEDPKANVHLRDCQAGGHERHTDNYGFKSSALL